MPSVSIIVPVYNVEKYLVECLDSLLGQTMQNFEIICIDDGSTDRSADILRRYASQDRRITVLTQENAGVSAARNAGIKRAQGDYLYFMDSDDVLSKNALETLWNCIEATCADLVVFGMNDIYGASYDPWFEETASPHFAWYPRFMPEALFCEPSAMPFGARDIFRREMIAKNDIWFSPSLRLGEDLLFQMTAFPCARRIVFIPDKLYGYRKMRDSSATQISADPVDLVFLHLELIQSVKDEWKKRGFLERYRTFFYRWMVGFVFDRINILPDEKKKEAASIFSRYYDEVEPCFGDMQAEDAEKYKYLKNISDG